MSDYSMSITIGEGNIGHNSNALRRQKLDNVDSSRTLYNVNLVHQDIKDAYHFLFDESVKNYNLTQKRSDRRISDYYKKIAKSKKEKPFYEFVIQIGNAEKHPDMDSCNEIYKEFVDLVQSKYPQIYIFGAYIHNDEATPHLHLDYIPYGTYEKGLSKRVSLSKAMSQMGYSFTGNDEREKGLYKEWRNDLLKDFELICGQYYINREIMNNHEKHEPNVQRYKEKVKLETDIQNLREEKATLESSCFDLFIENDDLQESFDRLSNEKQRIQSEIQNLESKKARIIKSPTSEIVRNKDIQRNIQQITEESLENKKVVDQLKKEKEVPEWELSLSLKEKEIFDKYSDLATIPTSTSLGGKIQISKENWEGIKEYCKIAKRELNYLQNGFNVLASKYNNLKNRFLDQTYNFSEYAKKVISLFESAKKTPEECDISAMESKLWRAENQLQNEQSRNKRLTSQVNRLNAQSGKSIEENRFFWNIMQSWIESLRNLSLIESFKSHFEKDSGEMELISKVEESLDYYWVVTESGMTLERIVKEIPQEVESEPVQEVKTYRGFER